MMLNSKESKKGMINMVCSIENGDSESISGDNVNDNMKDNVSDNVKDIVKYNVKDNVNGIVNDNKKDNFSHNVKENDSDHVKDIVKDSVEDNVKYVNDNVKDDVNDNVIDNVNDNVKEKNNAITVYKVYRSRWLMLFVVSFLNLSNAIMWLTFAPVADTFIAYYGITSSQLNMLSMTFLIATIPLGFVATWVLDTLGLRASLLIAAWLNSAGGLLRNISTFDTVPKKYSYAILLCGQILAACAQPFVMFAPTKLAATWFPCQRRATANTIGSMMKPLGNMVSFIFIPFMVDDTSDIPLVLWVTSALAFFITIVTTFGIRDSKPPTPPSHSASKTSTPFLSGLKKIIFNKNYIVLNLVFGGGQALFTAVTAFMEQILCPRGYTDEFSGLCASLMLGVGMIMAVPVSLYVDKTKQFDEVFKVSYGLSALFAIVFTQVSRLRDQHVWIAFMTALFGGCGISIYAIGFELAVEVTYPIAAATGSGLCLVGGQIQGIIYMLIMQYLTRPLPADEMHLETGCYVPENIDADTKILEPHDWTYSNLYILNGISCAAFVLSVLFFSPKYKRLEAERKAMEFEKKYTCISTVSSAHL